MKKVCKFVRKLVERRRMRKDAREAAYGALCVEQKDKSLFSWERDILRERSRKTRQAWIMAALDGDSKKQAWLAGAIECGIIKL